MQLVPPSFKLEFTKYQKQLVNDLSRSIIIGMGSSLSEQCPNCYFDIVNKVSSATPNDTFVTSTTLFAGTAYERTVSPSPFKNICPVCRGKGIISVPNEVVIPAHIIWELREDGPAGPPGNPDQAKASLKADSKYETYFRKAEYFIVDGRKLALKDHPIVRGMGSANGIVEVTCYTTDSAKEIK